MDAKRRSFRALSADRPVVYWRSPKRRPALSRVPFLPAAGPGSRGVGRNQVRRCNLKVKTEMKGDVAVVHVSGKLMGGPESENLRNEIKRLLEDGVKKFVISLKGVPWINSTGLGALMAVYTSVQRSEGALALCHVSDRIQSLFMITKLLTIFDTHPSEQEAVESLS